MSLLHLRNNKHCFLLNCHYRPDKMSLQHQLNETRIHRAKFQSTTAGKLIALRPMVVWVWRSHFLVSIVMMLWGCILNSDGHKYIPISTSALGYECTKAYANVFASSITDSEAVICCSLEVTDGICGSSPRYLPLVRRLTRFPEAWLLPLFPLLVRWVTQLVIRRKQRQNGAKIANEKELNLSKEIDTFTKRRFYLYFCLVQIRTWILYVLFDKFEDLIVQPAGDECWYKTHLRSNQHSCSGKETDFSDHIVFFFAQILPIPLTEILFSFVAPYWKNNGYQGKVIPTILSTGLLYLYGISFLQIYRTSAYFHTRFEIFIGYLISLMIQIPLFLIMSTSLMEPATSYFFG